MRIGDPVTMQLGLHPMRNDCAFATAMDDKSGCGSSSKPFAGPRCEARHRAVLRVDRAGRDRPPRRPDGQLSASIRRSESPSTSRTPPIARRSTRSRKGTCALGGGPVIYRGPNMNPRVVDRLVEVAEKGAVPYQMAASGRATGTDANAMQVSRAGMATGLVSIPNRYMHSPVEMISLTDIDHTANLLAGFALSMKSTDDFTP